MTAGAAVELAFAVAVAASAAYATLAVRAVKRGEFTGPDVGVTAGVGTAFGLAAGLPLVLMAARRGPSATPILALLLLLWTVVAALALRRAGGRDGSVVLALALALLAAVPATSVALAAGTVGGAARDVRACQGNLQALSGAFRSYVAEKHHWPPEQTWLKDIMAQLPAPAVFHCPDRPGRPYSYHRPAPDSPGSTAVIECDHRFLGEKVVLHKDFQVTVEGL